MLAGPAEAAADGGALAALRADSDVSRAVSGVDDLDSPVGRVDVVLALREQLSGGAGPCGTAECAGGVRPAAAGGAAVSAAAALRAGVALAAAHGAARRLGTLLREHPPAGARHWDRRNHRGHVVTLLEGPTAALAAAAGASLATSPWRSAGVLATLGAGAFGALDPT